MAEDEEDFPWPDPEAVDDDIVADTDGLEEAAVTVSEDALVVDDDEVVEAVDAEVDAEDVEACADPYLGVGDDAIDEDCLMTAEEEAEAEKLVEPEISTKAPSREDVWKNLQKPKESFESPTPPVSAASPRNDTGKNGGKDKGKGKGKGKDGKGKDKGKGKGKDSGKGKDKGQDKAEFFGFVYEMIPASKTLLIKCWKCEEEHGGEAVIPAWNNPAGVKVGDRIGFDVEEMVQEGDGDPRPMASNVFVRSHADDSKKAQVHKGRPLTDTRTQGRPPTDTRTQVLYYLSDENLKRDKFFHDVITQTEGGWIATATILGCRRIQQLGASTKSILDAVRDAPGVEIREDAGEEAVRRTTPPPALEGEAASETTAKPNVRTSSGTIKPQVKPQVKPQASPVSMSISNSECFYAGKVNNQAQNPPHKFFIACESIKEKFGFDAFFLPDQKPAKVEVGSLVAFTLPLGVEKGRSPQARFVAELAPLGESLLESSGGDAGQSKKRRWDGSPK